MPTDFVLQVSLHLSLQKQSAQAVDEESQPCHLFSSNGSGKRIMISAARRLLSFFGGGQGFVLLLFQITPVDEQHKLKPVPVGSQH